MSLCRSVFPLDAGIGEAPHIIENAASPFSLRKQVLRQDMLSACCRRHGLPLAYCNQVGGNDELVFDGRSAVIAADGTMLARAEGFAEDVLLRQAVFDPGAARIARRAR